MMLHGVRIHYRLMEPPTRETKGNVLFVHGFAGSTFCWRHNTDTLVQLGYRVVLVDPALGYSDKDPGIDLSTGEQAVRLWELCDSLRPETRTKNRSRPACGFLVRKAASAPYVQRWAEVIGKYKFYNYKSFEKLLGSAYACTPDSEAVNGYLRPFLLKRSASAVFDMSASKEYFSIDDRKLTMPMLVIWGDKDTWIPIRSGKEFAHRHQLMDFWVIAGAGHCGMETHWQEYNRIVAAFLGQDNSR